ncbi:hypothetical protein, partial [Porphyromonas sp.]|uniref:hypothetical protein n=1 Tax=Porphyromonas sp. TaxID=1924944 RepID=UPI0025F11322
VNRHQFQQKISQPFSGNHILLVSHVAIFESPRREKTFSTWARNKTSEESNETSEKSFRPYVENKK